MTTQGSHTMNVMRWHVVVIALGLFAVSMKPSAAYTFPDLDCPQTPSPVPLLPPMNSSAPTGVPDVSELPQWLQDALHDVDGKMSAIVKKHHTPGASIGVVYDQRVVWTNTYGRADIVTRRKLHADTPFRIGSLSKIFAVLSIMQLQEAGVLSIDDEVAAHVPEAALFLSHNPYDVPFTDTSNNGTRTPPRGVTFRQLASHTAGLQRECPCGELNNGCLNVTTLEMLARLRDTIAVQPVNTRPSYSNCGFALLGRLVELLINRRGDMRTYEQYVADEITGPLGMTSTGFAFTRHVKERMARGYLLGSPLPAPYTELGWAASAGQMYSSTNDLMKLASLMFRYNYTMADIPNDQLLSGPSLREMMAPVWVSGAAPLLKGMGLPWEMVRHTAGPQEGYWITSKGGSITGYTAHINLVPEIKLGVVTLFSDGVDGHAGVAATGAMDVLLPAFDNAVKEAQQRPSTLSIPDVARRYAGTFVGSEGPLWVRLTGLHIDISNLTDGNEPAATLTLEVVPPPNMRAHARAQVADKHNDLIGESYFAALVEALESLAPLLDDGEARLVLDQARARRWFDGVDGSNDGHHDGIKVLSRALHWDVAASMFRLAMTKTCDTSGMSNGFIEAAATDNGGVAADTAVNAIGLPGYFYGLVWTRRHD